MTQLYLPQSQRIVTEYHEIQSILQENSVKFERWKTNQKLKDTDDQETILKAYEHEIIPFMKSSGFVSADVINVHHQTANLPELRQKFLKEHTHSEDEVRFFVDGGGIFWFHLDNKLIIRLHCTKGDFLAVPKGFRHWFDLAPLYFVKAIRIFSNKEGWVANYTESKIDEKYNEI